MKIVEVTSTLSVSITNEEADLYNRFDEETPVMAKHTLNDRERLIANQLVNKDLLLRKNQDGQIIYKKRKDSGR
tara:strand:+ start:234 stop:455 length:222 start_codon:yes stop_codon:yes gene_type:complete